MTIPLAIGAILNHIAHKAPDPRTGLDYEGTIGSEPFLSRCAMFWSQGNNSRQIAYGMQVHESEIYNRMDEIKTRAALLRGGNAA